MAAAVSHFLVDKYHFSAQGAKRISSAMRNSTNLQKVDSCLSFLKERGLSNAQLERIVTRRPLVLCASIENSIEPKLKVLQDFGFSASEIVGMVSKDPDILTTSASKITATLSVLKSLLGSHERLAKVLSTKIGLLYSASEETLLPNIHLLKTCGIPMVQIVHQFCLFPSFLRIKPETMRNAVLRVDEMGVERTSKMFMYVLHVVSSIASETWELKLKTFQDLGVPKDGISRMLRITPSLFTLSQQKIQKVIELLLETGKYDLQCIINHPKALGYSVEERCKPRVQVLKVLEKRNLIDRWPSLQSLSNMPNRTFFQRFVEPYTTEVGETIIAKDAHLQI